MKILHTADLHIGKLVNGFSMLSDQKYILEEILKITDREQPDVFIIAGDVYDKSVPSAEAVVLFDDFLCRLAKKNLHIFIISGNHDSAERIAFGGRLMEQSGVHLSPVYRKGIRPVVLADEHGPVNFYLLPFIKPVHVRMQFPEEEIRTYADAVRTAVNGLLIDCAERNVLVTHQFIAGSERSDSEEMSVGGTDSIPSSVFDNFDYVALGHIHKPQRAGRETVRYSGSPLKYSISEASHSKSVTIVELGEKGEVRISTESLKPLRDIRVMKGTYDELMHKGFYSGFHTGDYCHVILTDEENIPDALRKMQTVYPNIMRLDYDNLRTQNRQSLISDEKSDEKPPLELVEDFYKLQNNSPLTDSQKSFAEHLIETIWEERT